MVLSISGAQHVDDPGAGFATNGVSLVGLDGSSPMFNYSQTGAAGYLNTPRCATWPISNSLLTVFQISSRYAPWINSSRRTGWVGRSCRSMRERLRTHQAFAVRRCASRSNRFATGVPRWASFPASMHCAPLPSCNAPASGRLQVARRTRQPKPEGFMPRQRGARVALALV